MINLGILKWVYILDYPGGSNVIKGVLLSEKKKQEDLRKRDVRREVELRML